MFRTSTLARGVGLIAIVDELAKAHPPSLEIVDICLRATCPRVRVMGQTPELVGRQRREIINLRGEGRVANDRARRTARRDLFEQLQPFSAHAPCRTMFAAKQVRKAVEENS